MLSSQATKCPEYPGLYQKLASLDTPTSSSQATTKGYYYMGGVPFRARRVGECKIFLYLLSLNGCKNPPPTPSRGGELKAFFVRFAVEGII